MIDFIFGGLQFWQLAILASVAILAGINKTGMPGVGIVMVPLLALCVPARESTGLLLPLLCLADLFAVIYYRKHATWSLVFKLLPWSLTGILSGSLLMRVIDDKQLKPMIGFIVLSMLIMSWTKLFKGKKKRGQRRGRGQTSLDFRPADGLHGRLYHADSQCRGPDNDHLSSGDGPA